MSSPHKNHPGRYKDCRRPDCQAYRERYRKRWVHDRAHGKKRTTDPAPVRAHIQTLLGADWSHRAIAGAAGISPSVVGRLIGGQQTSIRISTAQQILAIEIDSVPAHPSSQVTEPFVPRVGTTRRLQALLWMGWGHQQMREHTGGLNTASLLHQQGRWVTKNTHERVAAMFTELAMTPGPSSKARFYARQRGYLSPLAWDDIDRDEQPATVPDDFFEETLTQTVTRLRAEGYGNTEIAARTGSTPRAVAALSRGRAHQGAGERSDEQAIWRRVNGDRNVELTTQERREAVRDLHRAGASTRTIAHQLGYAKSNVGSDLVVLGLTPNPPESAHIVPATKRSAS